MQDDEALDEIGQILSDGWCKGALHKAADGRTTEAFAANRETSCILGAIELVGMEETQSTRVQRKIVKGIARLTGQAPLGGWFPNIPSFNDARETTQEDVLLAVKYAKEEDA